MDLMEIRYRMLMSVKKNYLKNVVWKDSGYITAGGVMKADNSDASSYMLNAIFLKAGTYFIKGFNSYTGANKINYRIHEYNSTDKWIKQVTFFTIPNKSSVNESFTLEHDSYIRLSMARNYFSGTLTKKT